MKRIVRRARRRLGHYLGVLPDFLIVGAQRAGTSALYAYLCEHPDVCPARKKEIGFFNRHFGNGPAWYRSHFPLQSTRLFRTAVGRDFMTGDADPAYVLSPHYLRRIARLLPDAKLLLLLRNPVDRAYSHYHHAVRLGYEPFPFALAIGLEQERIGKKWRRMLEDDGYYDSELSRYSYLHSSEYDQQVAALLEIFSRERLCIIESEGFFAAPARTLIEVEEFLGLTPHVPERLERVNAGSYEPMDPALRRRLDEYFRQGNERLCALLERHPSWVIPSDTNGRLAALMRRCPGRS